MARGPLYQEGYTPQFSGHETFPLRYGWLKKAFDRVEETEDQPENRAACWDDEAVGLEFRIRSLNQSHWKAFFNSKAPLLAQKNDALRLSSEPRTYAYNYRDSVAAGVASSTSLSSVSG